MNHRYEAFRTARDFLLAHRTDYAAARAGFAWPRVDQFNGQFDGHFNWALDYFDAIARDDHPALWIVAEDGSEDKRSFAELSTRSNRVANWLRSLGVARGDRVLLMLGNERPLWE